MGYKPLFKDSQHSPDFEDAILFANTKASAEELMEAAEYRGNAALGILRVFAFTERPHMSTGKDRDLALGLLLLTSDAMSLYALAYEKLEREGG